MGQLVGALRDFLRRPTWDQAETPRAPLVRMWLVGLLGAFLLSQIAALAVELGDFTSRLDNELDDLTFLELVVLVAVVAPILEETIYRLVLTRELKMWLLAACSVASIALVGVAGIVVAVVVLGMWALRRGDDIVDWWARHPGAVIWGTVIAFGLAHVRNFDVPWSPLTVVLLPVIVLPQIWLGLCFSFVRVRWTWTQALVLHAVHNAVVALATYPTLD